MMGGGDKPLEIYCPEGVEEGLKATLAQLSALHSWPLEVSCHSMSPGDERHLKGNLWLRALKTFHPVASLGFLFFERVQKLKSELMGLPGAEIKARKEQAKRGELSLSALFDQVDRPKLAYLTDTLIEALKHNPVALEAETLILECTFLNNIKPVAIARAGCHIHLDELVEWAPLIKSKRVVLMHFSQLHKPSEVKALCEERLGPILGERLHLLLPPDELRGRWWL
jgi:ribonuclease Z